AAHGNQDIVAMAEGNQFRYHTARHQTERTSREFQGINVLTHRFENVLEVSSAHGRVVGSTDFSDSAGSRLGSALIGPEESERPFLDSFLCFGGHYASFVR